jgi:hypothetical protein
MAVLKNVSPSPVRVLRVTAECYDFFGKLLWMRTAVPTPASIGPGDTASLSVSTPRLESVRRIGNINALRRRVPHSWPPSP